MPFTSLVSSHPFPLPSRNRFFSHRGSSSFSRSRSRTTGQCGFVSVSIAAWRVLDRLQCISLPLLTAEGRQTAIASRSAPRTGEASSSSCTRSSKLPHRPLRVKPRRPSVPSRTFVPRTSPRLLQHASDDIAGPPRVRRERLPSPDNRAAWRFLARQTAQAGWPVVNHVIDSHTVSFPCPFQLKLGLVPAGIKAPENSGGSSRMRTPAFGLH